MLIKVGLDKLFRDFQTRTIDGDKHGLGVRAKLSENPATTIESAEVGIARQIAAFFGDLEFPTAVILLTMRPQASTNVQVETHDHQIEELLASERFGQEERRYSSGGRGLIEHHGPGVRGRQQQGYTRVDAVAVHTELCHQHRDRVMGAYS